MILPAVKLGTLVLKTMCKPIANRLKKQAGLHPRFRHLIINFAQAMKQRDEELEREVQLLKKKREELEQLAQGRGIGGLCSFRHAQATGNGKDPPA